MATEIQGSWFPTGYYGHFRSKSRADFVNEYRQLARPIPPKKFINRAKEPTRKHVFSHHDNRQAFLNDALIFQQGLGRRRVPNSTYQFKNDFMAWMPEREYIERSRPLVSTYKVDFMPSQAKSQIWTKRPKTSFDGVATTSYKYAHGKGAPNKDSIDAMNNESLKLSLLNRKDRAMTSLNKGRESVASCMTWSSFKPKPPSTGMHESTKPVVPLATQTSEFVPHPPSAPKQQTFVPASQPVQQAWPAPEPVTQYQQAPPPVVQAPPPVVQAPPPVQQPMAE